MKSLSMQLRPDFFILISLILWCTISFFQLAKFYIYGGQIGTMPHIKYNDIISFLNG